MAPEVDRMDLMDRDPFWGATKRASQSGQTQYEANSLVQRPLVILVQQNPS